MKKMILALIILSIIGVFLLLTLSLIKPIPQLKIKEITNKHINKQVKISGEIKYIKNFNNFQLITINDSTSQITITNFNQNKNFSKKQKIIVIGRIQEYNNTLEINSEKIYLISLKLS